MNQQNLKKLLDNYSAIANPIIRQYFRADCCIAATRITIRVLKEFGVRAEPLTTQCKIFNPQFVEAVTKGEQMPSNEHEAMAWMKERDAWTIGIGFGETDIPNNKLGGHLVAVIPDSLLVVDASINQADRPERNITLPPVLITPIVNKLNLVSENFSHLVKNTTLLVYHPLPDVKNYLQSPNWFSNQTDAATKELIKLLKK